MKRVITNLLDNAISALKDMKDPKVDIGEDYDSILKIAKELNSNANAASSYSHAISDLYANTWNSYSWGTSSNYRGAKWRK